MGEFFRGWRRKLGSILLLMAFLAYGEWMRSYVYYDLIWIEAFNTSCGFVTNAGKFRVEIGGTQFEELYGWRDYPISEAENLMFGTPNGPVRTSDANLPFCPFVLAITLLSGALIIYPGKRSSLDRAKTERV
ncbi:MAG: hypothetical protein WCJ09_10610 [Planctomycetota bacterium]